MRNPIFGWAALALLTLLFSGRGSVAQETEPPGETATASSFQRDDVDESIDKAIAYLLTQQREDGAIVDKSHDTTMTALAIMAMASVGYQTVEPSNEGQAMARIEQHAPPGARGGLVGHRAFSRRPRRSLRSPTG